MRTILFVVALGVPLVATAAPPTATAPPASATPAVDEDSAKARSFFEKGMGHFQLQEYDAAIDKWQAGFRLKPVPEFLYNIAQAYRLSKRPEKALQFYKTYLRLAPAAPNRVEVERHVAALKKLIEQQQSTASAPPQDPVIPGRPTSGDGDKPQGATPATTSVTTPASDSTATVAPASQPARADLTATATKKPITKRPWFWVVVGGGAALVVGAVIVGVVVGTRGDSTKSLPALRF
ncbi:MAG: Thiol-disulfide isomerase [Myxococcales bacterium]|nr:Thiol-disulfide isomerase [Myxococcales bacterium]